MDVMQSSFIFVVFLGFMVLKYTRWHIKYKLRPLLMQGIEVLQRGKDQQKQVIINKQTDYSAMTVSQFEIYSCILCGYLCFLYGYSDVRCAIFLQNLVFIITYINLVCYLFLSFVNSRTVVCST